MKIENLPIDSLKPYGKNPRRNAKAVGPVAESIKQFGFRQPIVVDKDMTIIVGHTRWLAAKQLGLPEVPVHVSDMGARDAKAYRIADNRLNEIAKWDMGSLSDEIKELKGLDFDINKLGFHEIELKTLLTHDEAEIERENALPDKTETRCKPGDVWILGEHRLLCGDSSNAYTYERLLGNAEADMVWTDPPYGVDIKSHNEMLEKSGKARNDKSSFGIENDGTEDIEKTILPALSLSMAHTKSGGVWYVATPPAGNHLKFFKWIMDQEAYRQTIQWVKDSMVLGRSDYHYQHEPILYGWKPGASHHSPPTRDQTSVWNVARPKVSKDHPTMKPVELVERAIINSSDKGETILDPFSGSGTTLIACEKTNRKCRAIEIYPKYCDVILTRWETYTGRQAIREV